jgi:hypothetical protein
MRGASIRSAMRDGERRAAPRESRALRIFVIIWIPFSLVVLALIGWTVYELRGLFPYAKHIVDSSPMPSRSLEPVEILFQSLDGRGTRLSIPAAYMHWSDNRKPGLQWNIAFLAVYPEMTPYTLLDAQGRKALDRAEAAGGELRYDLLGHITVANPDSIARFLQDMLSRKNVTFLGEQNGFQVYRQKVANSLNDYLIPVDAPKTPTRYMQCGAMTDEQLAKAKRLYGCQMHVQYSDRLSFDYHLAGAARAQWPEIDRRMVELLRTFVIDCFEGAKLKPGDPLPATHSCDDNFRKVE